jgi:hypothetical protein
MSEDAKWLLSKMVDGMVIVIIFLLLCCVSGVIIGSIFYIFNYSFILGFFVLLCLLWGSLYLRRRI